MGPFLGPVGPPGYGEWCPLLVGLGGLPVGLASWQHFWDCCADTEGVPWAPRGLLVVTAVEASWPASVYPHLGSLSRSQVFKANHGL